MAWPRRSDTTLTGIPAPIIRVAWVWRSAFNFSQAAVGWAEVAELMETSYRQVASKRMLKAFDVSPG